MSRKLGNKGEKIAESYLKSCGYEILERNFYIRGGEIDLITKKDDQIVFVEVKTRTNENYGSIYEQITEKKQKFLINAAVNYLNKKNLDNVDWRIDAVFIMIDNDFKLEHIKNAIIL